MNRRKPPSRNDQKRKKALQLHWGCGAFCYLGMDQSVALSS